MGVGGSHQACHTNIVKHGIIVCEIQLRFRIHETMAERASSPNTRPAYNVLLIAGIAISGMKKYIG